MSPQEGDRIGAKHIGSTSPPLDMVGPVSLVSIKRLAFSSLLLFVQPCYKSTRAPLSVQKHLTEKGKLNSGIWGCEDKGSGEGIFIWPQIWRNSASSAQWQVTDKSECWLIREGQAGLPLASGAVRGQPSLCCRGPPGGGLPCRPAGPCSPGCGRPPQGQERGALQGRTPLPVPVCSPVKWGQK